jgi:NAD-dependent deacetylase
MTSTTTITTTNRDTGVDIDSLARAARLLREAERVAVLTGAGVSAESGVTTFRGSYGLWEGHRIDEVATPMAFHDNPRLVWGFYNLRRSNLRSVQPNSGHAALAELERRYSGDGFALITQNVDGLHRRAGSQRVLELHGNLSRTRCTQCHKIEDRGLEELGELPHCPHCGGLLRPDIVWFHEALPENIWEEAALMTSQCDAFLVVGTSAVVYPAAGLIVTAKRGGAKVIEVNLTETDASYHADVRLAGPSGVLLPALVKAIG